MEPIPQQETLTIGQVHGGLFKTSIEHLNLIGKNLLTQEQADRLLVFPFNQEQPPEIQESLALVCNAALAAQRQERHTPQR
jgi:hypothetical protein|uniref:hypothetical protein n=1 Tax=Prosthecobacter sp. TaxID=1965333 RepID=UPI003784BF79